MNFNPDCFTIPILIQIANAISEEISNEDLGESEQAHQREVFEAVCKNIENRGFILSDNVVIPENL